jgi:hypothetical protein
MYEGSEESVNGGLGENIEAIHCQACFAGYPSNGLTFRNTTCADSWCDGTYRGKKKSFNFWNFGDNASVNVESYDNIVEGSFYEGCLPG